MARVLLAALAVTVLAVAAVDAQTYSAYRYAGPNPNGFGAANQTAPSKYIYDQMGCFAKNSRPAGAVAAITAERYCTVNFCLPFVGCLFCILSDVRYTYAAFGNPYGVDIMSTRLCTAACMYQGSGYRYAYASTERFASCFFETLCQYDTYATCYCSNNPPTAGAVASSNCNSVCPVEIYKNTQAYYGTNNIEYCGGTEYQYDTVSDSLKTVGGIGVYGYPTDGSLCSIYNALFVATPTSLTETQTPSTLSSIQAYALYYLPEDGVTRAPDQVALYRAVQHSSINMMLTCTTACTIDVTFIFDGASSRHQLGVYTADAAGNPTYWSFVDIFADASRSKGNTVAGGAGTTSKGGLWLTCRNYGDTVRLTYPTGTRVGFYMHKDGATDAAIVPTKLSNCRTSANFEACVIRFGAHYYPCWTQFGCPIDPNYEFFNGPQSPTPTWYSTRANIDSKQHIAMIDTPYGVIVGFEETQGTNTPDFNDAMLLLKLTGASFSKIAKTCTSKCNSANGLCDYLSQTGECKCTNTSPLLTPTCDCVNGADTCGVNGQLVCGTNPTCQCNNGYTSRTAAQADCDCRTDPGDCFNTNGVWTCDTCVCNAGFTNPLTTFLGGLSNIVFGTDTTQTPATYTLDAGAVISASPVIGSYGWEFVNTANALGFGQPSTSLDTSSNCFPGFANWYAYVNPSTTYIITVTFGSNTATTNTLTVFTDDSRQASIASNVAVAANTFTTRTVTILSGPQGIFRFSNTGGSSCTGNTATRVTRISISVRPCGCAMPTGPGCGTNGKYNCNGQCTCNPGFTSVSGGQCNACATGFFGATCAACPSCGVNGRCSGGVSGTGACVCDTGYTGAGCDECAEGYKRKGSSCVPCSACVSGTCSATGTCDCFPGWAGQLCDACAPNFGGSSCTACPDCQNGVCDQGLTGSALCNCNTGFTAPDGSTTFATVCDRCASGRYGASCTACNCGMRGTCSQGINGTGACTCQTGYAQSNPAIPQSPCNTCASGFYASGSTCRSCLATQGCATCTLPPIFGVQLCNTCLTQAFPNQLTNVFGLCTVNCTAGYYQVNQLTCGSCNATCATCIGPAATQCESCATGLVRSGNLCKSSCATNEFLSGSTCQACAASCATCSGAAAAQCLSCSGSNKLFDGQCIATCPAGTFANANVCTNCDATCATCTAASATSCATCSDGRFLNSTSTTGACVTTCPAGTFGASNRCQSCASSCSACSSLSSCSACASGFYLTETSCVAASACPVGTFANAMTSTCSACDASCQSCTAAGADKCLKCAVAAKFFYKGTCYDSCPSGTSAAVQNDENVCVDACGAGKYGPSCVDCTCDNGVCDDGLTGTGECACNKGWAKSTPSVATATCDVCAAGHFGDSCTPCPNCQNGTCGEGLDGNGLCACSIGWVGELCDACAANYGGATCSPCPDCQNGVCSEGINGSGKCNCNTNFAGPDGVSATGVDVCDKCIGGRFGANCTACDCGRGTCAEGISNNGACTCETGWAQTTPDVAQSPCDTCETGYYASNGQCVECQFPCATCSSKSFCLSCAANADALQLSNGVCSLTCPAGKFQVSTYVCGSCDATCATCSGAAATDCLTCAASTPLFFGSTCVAECPAGYYSDGTRCEVCGETCETCTGAAANQCVSCTGLRGLYQTSCLTAAEGPAGLYLNLTQNLFLPCDTLCGTCTGGAANECTGCGSGSVLDGTTCVAFCPSGKWDNNGVCAACSTSCAACSGAGASSCTSCPSGSFLSSGVCVTVCPSGKFANSASNTCDDCDPLCATCTSAGVCQTCTASAYFYQSQCYASCGAFTDTFADDATRTCAPCKTCGSTCQNGGTCGCATGQCQCAAGWSGPTCTCSTASCPTGLAQGASVATQCSSQGSCACGQCVCDVGFFGSKCDCKRCDATSQGSVTNDCSGAQGTCGCDGKCTCGELFYGPRCQFRCLFDACDVCNGNGLSCAGCDGEPNSGKVFDACAVCGGDNSTCAGCDGVPNSGKVYDVCGVCNGNGDSCREERYCANLGSCESCNVRVGAENRQYCVWCNATSSCLEIGKASTCGANGLSAVFTCPTAELPTAPGSTAGQNAGNSNAGLIAGIVVAAVVVAAVIGGLLYMRAYGKGPLYFEPPDLDALPTFQNPLYQEYSPSQENPLYEQPPQ